MPLEKISNNFGTLNESLFFFFLVASLKPQRIPNGLWKEYF